MADDDFYLLVPEDEWARSDCRLAGSWDDRDEFEMQFATPTIGQSADAWWYLWTGVALVLWTVFCVWAGFDFGRRVEPVLRCSFGCAGATARGLM